MQKSYPFYRDIAVGVFFVGGVLGFMSGEFIISTVLFCVATLVSNLGLGGKAIQS